MRKNNKGFTLVELIVVMAIIAVLAAILVPTMLGFMKNAKITQANANAKTVYTAFNSVIADYTVDNGSIQGKAQSPVMRGSDLLDDAGVNLSKSSSGGEANFKMASYLEGINPDSYVIITTNDSGTGVHYALYSIGKMDTSNVQVTKQEQKDATGDIVGCYPLKQ